MANLSSLTLPVKNPSTGEVTQMTFDLNGGGSSSNFVGTLSEWNALTDSQKAEYDTYDITDDFNGVPYEIQTGTLSAGSTSITLSFSNTIGATTLVDIYTDTYEVNPTAVATTSSTVTLTFDAQESAVTVGVKIIN